MLLGAEDGFFALNPLSTSGQQHLVQLSGFSGVHHLVLAKGVNLILVLLGMDFVLCCHVVSGNDLLLFILNILPVLSLFE